MPERIVLRGMTWNHSRGLDPMLATSARYAEMHPGVEIVWEKRSLQAFADRPIGEMASDYDLMVIDHPHVGEVADSGHLLALDTVGREAEMAALAAGSVGLSHPSYEFDGHQWALAIDAATPVACYRPDLMDAAPESFDSVLELAAKGQVACALIPINTLMTFFGLARNQGMAVAETPDRLMARDEAEEVLDLLLSLSSKLDPRCLTLDPIGVYEWMGRTLDAPAYSPFGYGYTNYSREGYCRFPLVFADAPGSGQNGPQGTVLGGTGIAVSSQCQHRDVAVDYAFWIAGAECQSGLFFDAGGQPGHAAAWEDPRCNAACRDFFVNTRKTLETAWLRPRYDGYMGFQDRGGDILHACLRGEAAPAETLDRLDAAYRESRA
ncbi:extracellular solute-binding protein [Alphaproteobacteria bacterium GH1-50]|uniref:Extracellular solute-binding protein n=1 Tax=Kangsaoukella pontilimi TaxID=2691042 RepID=A0A7C9MQI3_9RHOB|nr:extracellular solute-binding protein [Kangsaoukella pontilimi]MXQ07437.1 extracellular solute-binding protein [Kangsaoukella pontilimi]